MIAYNMRYPVQRDPSSIVAAKEALYEQMEEHPGDPDRSLTINLGLAYIDQNPRETVQRRLAWSAGRKATYGSGVFMSKSVTRATTIRGLGGGSEQVDLGLETRTHHNKRMLVPDFYRRTLPALGRLGFQEGKPFFSTVNLTFEHGTWSVVAADDDGFTLSEMSSMKVDDTVEMRSEGTENKVALMMAERLLALPERPRFY